MVAAPRRPRQVRMPRPHRLEVDPLADDPLTDDPLTDYVLESHPVERHSLESQRREMQRLEGHVEHRRSHRGGIRQQLAAVRLRRHWSICALATLPLLAMSSDGVTTAADPPGASAPESPEPAQDEKLALDEEVSNGKPARNEKPAQNGELAAEIAVAVERGREALRPHLARLRAKPPKDYPIGRLGIVLCALYKSGLSVDDTEATQALAGLQEGPHEKVYDVACWIFAVDAYEGERRRALRQALQRGRRAPDALDAMTDSTLTADSQKALRTAVDWLVKARRQRSGGWSYASFKKGDRIDFSNTQFAVLALHMAWANGVRAPPSVFEEVATLFSASLRREAKRRSLALRWTPSLDARLGLRDHRPAAMLQIEPGGWGYRPPTARDRAGQNRKPDQEEPGGQNPEDEGAPRFGNLPYPSMTAAGASSLSIAATALRADRRPPGKLLRECERATLSAHAWIAHHFSTYVKDDRNLGYRLYSLEKAGDLAGIEMFGEYDWYQRGAEALLRKQRPKGNFGSYIDTAFALLFLTRASRTLGAGAPPKFTTGEGSKNDPAASAAAGLVYLPRAEGLFPAAELLFYLAQHRSARHVKIAREAWTNAPRPLREDLVPTLLYAWQRRDRMTSFCRAALREVTGVDSTRKQDYRDWFDKLRELQQLATEESLDASALERTLRGLANTRLKEHCVRLAHQRNLRTLLPVLIAEMRVDDAAYRRELDGVLRLWTRTSVPRPETDTEATWRATAKAWKRWWREHK